MKVLLTILKVLFLPLLKPLLGGCLVKIVEDNQQQELEKPVTETVVVEDTTTDKQLNNKNMEVLNMDQYKAYDHYSIVVVQVPLGQRLPAKGDTVEVDKSDSVQSKTEIVEIKEVLDIKPFESDGKPAGVLVTLKYNK